MPGCNLHKASRITAIDPETGEETQLFHPLEQLWPEHLRFKGYQMEGLTAVGRATVATLNLNHSRRQRIREVEEAFGFYPPCGDNCSTPFGCDAVFVAQDRRGAADWVEVDCQRLTQTLWQRTSSPLRRGQGLRQPPEGRGRSHPLRQPIELCFLTVRTSLFLAYLWCTLRRTRG
jgi:hypothetical protein